jgi:hypothetical protein
LCSTTNPAIITVELSSFKIFSFLSTFRGKRRKKRIIFKTEAKKEILRIKEEKETEWPARRNVISIDHQWIDMQFYQGTSLGAKKL